MNQALLAGPDFYPHIQIRLLAQNWPIFIRIDLRHLAKIWEILSAKKSGILGYFQGSCLIPQLSYGGDIYAAIAAFRMCTRPTLNKATRARI
jgi:hypothetical protein